MTTTPTFRVADGMLKENARERMPLSIDPRYADRSGAGTLLWRKDCKEYVAHLASLRSIPIAPGCVFEKVDGLVEHQDFVEVVYTSTSSGQTSHHAYPVKKPAKDLNGALRQAMDTTPPARAFSLAEGKDIYADGFLNGLAMLKKHLKKNADGNYDLSDHIENYFKQRFNQDI